MQKGITIIICILLLSKIANTQDLRCRSLLKNYTEKLGAIRRPVGNKTYFLDISIENELKDKSIQNLQKDRIKIIVNSKYFRYLSTYMEIYGDEKLTVTLVKNQKVIVLGKSISPELQQKNAMSMTILRDTIIDLSEISECQLVKSKDGSSNIETELIPSAHVRKLLQLEKMKFTFTHEKENLIRMEVWGSMDSPVKKSITIFNVLDLDYKIVNINASVLSLFFTKEGRLTEKYRDYRIIDNR